jgi:hypothetical protein
MKIRILIWLFVLFFIVNSSSQLSTEVARDLAKNVFKLTDKDTVEVLGISKESDEVMLVKYKINDVQLNTKIRKYDRGWQLEEIQNERGVWLPASRIINLVEQGEKIALAKTEISSLARYLDEYILDNAVPPNQSGSYDENSPLYKALCPRHAKSIPIKDPWGNNYLIFCGAKVNGHYGLSRSATADYLIISLGQDGKEDVWIYDSKNPESGSYLDQDPNNDIINFNGIFIRGSKTFE